VFIGKSLCAKGGQSPIEAAAAGKAMILGPNMQNFRAVTRTFLEQQGAVQVSDEEGLREAISRLLTDAPARHRLGEQARHIVDQNLGAVDRSLTMLTSHPRMQRDA